MLSSNSDVTAVCILEGFQNGVTLQSADRVLKELGKSKAKEALQVLYLLVLRMYPMCGSRGDQVFRTRPTKL